MVVSSSIFFFSFVECKDLVGDGPKEVWKTGN